MAINKNHLFEELDGIKCAIVEKDVTKERVDFLKSLLTLNGFTVVVVASLPPKAAPVAKPVDTTTETSEPEPSNLKPETYIIGVTDLMFNPTNAIFGRQLKTKNRHIVTLAYWQQKETVSHDEIPYFN